MQPIFPGFSSRGGMLSVSAILFLILLSFTTHPIRCYPMLFCLLCDSNDVDIILFWILFVIEWMDVHFTGPGQILHMLMFMEDGMMREIN